MKFYEAIYKIFARPVRALYRVRVIGAENLPAGGRMSALLESYKHARCRRACRRAAEAAEVYGKEGAFSRFRFFLS